MNIVFILTQLESGGAQNRVFQTAEVMRGMGHNCDVVFFYPKRECFLSESKVVLSKAKPKSIFAIIRLFLSLISFLRSKPIDAVICNTCPANLFGSLAALFAGLKTRIATQTQPPGRLSWILRTADFLWCVLGIYRYSVANSEWTAEQFNLYPAAYRRRLHVVKNGINFHPAQISRSQARKKFGLADRDFAIISVGRLSKQKDHKTLIAAMDQVEGMLLIAGDGELKDEIENQIKESGLSGRVQLLGELDSKEIPVLFSAADVFVFPSLWETFGLAVVEAAIAELPVVASNIPVLRQVLTTKSTMETYGRFAEFGNPSSFAQEINFFKTDLSNREKEKEVSKIIEKENSIKQHATNLLDLISLTE